MTRVIPESDSAAAVDVGHLLVLFDPGADDPISQSVADVLGAVPAATVRDKLASLTGSDRLPSTAVGGLATVASTGAYSDLTGQPTIPTVPARAGAFTAADEAKLDGIEAGAQVNVGSEFTAAEKSKLAGVAVGAEVNVRPDWDETDTGSDAFILNKPTIPEGVTSRTDDEIGEAAFKNPPSTLTDNEKAAVRNAIGAGTTDGGGGGEDNVQANWDETDTQSDAYIQNKPTIPTVPARAGAFTAADEAKLDGIETGAQVNVGMEFTAADEAKLDGIEAGAQVNVGSEFTAAEKTKLDGIEVGAEVNVQADWGETDTQSDAYIDNKPTIPTLPSDASIGAKAFRNPPTDLSDGQKTAVRNAIGAGTGGGGTLPSADGKYTETIWGEDSGATSGRAWAFNFGNGWNSVDNGILILEDCELTKVGVSFETGSSAIGTWEIGAFIDPTANYDGTNNLPDASVITTTPATSSTHHQEVMEFDPPLALSEGQRLHMDVINSWTGASPNTAVKGTTGPSVRGTIRFALRKSLTVDGSGGSGEDNVQADWDETDTDSDAYILNKPTIPTVPARAGAFTAADEAKLDGIEAGAQVNVGMEFTAADEAKLDGIEAGAQVNVGSEFTAAEKTKLGGVAAGAQVNPSDTAIGEAAFKNPPSALTDNEKAAVRNAIGAGTTDGGGGGEDNVQADWDETDTDSDAYILNKPTIPTVPARAGAFTAADEAKLDGIEAGAQVNPTGAQIGQAAFNNVPQTLTANEKAGIRVDLGITLEYIGDTAFAYPPDDLTDTQKAAVRTAIGAGTGGGGGEDNVQADWDETDTQSDAFIENKPAIEPWAIESGPAIPIDRLAGGRLTPVAVRWAWGSSTVFTSGSFTGTSSNSGVTGSRMLIPDPSGGGFEQHFGVWVAADAAADVRDIDLDNDSLFDDDLGGVVPYALTVNGVAGFAWVNPDTVDWSAYAGQTILVTLGAASIDDLIDHRVHDIVQQADWDETDPLQESYIRNKPDLTTIGGGEDNVQADWDETDTDSDAYIQNKPTVPDAEFIRDTSAAMLQAGTGISLDKSDAADRVTINATPAGTTAITIKNYAIEFYDYTPTSGGEDLLGRATSWSNENEVVFLPRAGKVVGVSGHITLGANGTARVNAGTGALNSSYRSDTFTSAAVAADAAGKCVFAAMFDTPLDVAAAGPVFFWVDSINPTSPAPQASGISFLFEFEDTYEIQAASATEPTAYWWMHGQTLRWPDTDTDLPYVATRASNTRCRMRWGQTAPREDFNDFAGRVTSNIWVSPSSVDTDIDLPSPGSSFQVFTLPAGRYDIEVEMVYNHEQANYDLDCSLRKVTSGLDDVMLAQNFGRQFGRGFSSIDIHYPDLVTDGTEQFYIDSYVNKDQAHRYGGFLKITKRA